MGGVAWTREEDQLLRACIERHGEGKWHRIPHLAGLNRCRKSCRLRWLNYLRPNIKRGNFTDEEVEHIIELHKVYGNKWSLIARKLPGRTSNDVKNYWNCHLSKRLNSHHVIESSETTQNIAPYEYNDNDNNNNIQCESRTPHDWETTQNAMEINNPGPQDEAGPSTLQKELLPYDHDESHDHVDQTIVEREDHDKHSCVEEHRIMEELLSKDIIDLEDIKIRGSGDEHVWKWDFDDLTLDVESWTDFM